MCSSSPGRRSRQKPCRRDGPFGGRDRNPKEGIPLDGIRMKTAQDRLTLILGGPCPPQINAANRAALLLQPPDRSVGYPSTWPLNTRRAVECTQCAQDPERDRRWESKCPSAAPTAAEEICAIDAILFHLLMHFRCVGRVVVVSNGSREPGLASFPLGPATREENSQPGRVSERVRRETGPARRDSRRT